MVKLHAYGSGTCQSIFIEAVTAKTRLFCASRTSMTTSLRSPLASRSVPTSAAARAAPSDGSVQAVEVGALVITQEVRSMPDIEIVASHTHLLSQGMTPDQCEAFGSETKSLAPALGIL